MDGCVDVKRHYVLPVFCGETAVAVAMSAFCGVAVIAIDTWSSRHLALLLLFMAGSPDGRTNLHYS